MLYVLDEMYLQAMSDVHVRPDSSLSTIVFYKSHSDGLSIYQRSEFRITKSLLLNALATIDTRNKKGNYTLALLVSSGSDPNRQMQEAKSFGLSNYFLIPTSPENYPDKMFLQKVVSVSQAGAEGQFFNENFKIIPKDYTGRERLQERAREEKKRFEAFFSSIMTVRLRASPMERTKA